MAGDRFGRRRVIVTGLMVIAAGDLALLLTNDLLTLLLVAAVIGLGDFFTASQTALLTEIVPAAERTRTLSGYRFSADLGAMIGPIVLAAIMDASGVQAAIVAGAAILVISAVVTRLIVPWTVDQTRLSRAAAG
jgi:MFS family permease